MEEMVMLDIEELVDSHQTKQNLTSEWMKGVNGSLEVGIPLKFNQWLWSC